MSIEGQGHFFTIYFSGFVCFVLYLAKISGERLQDHWSSGFCLFIIFINKLATYVTKILFSKFSFYDDLRIAQMRAYAYRIIYFCTIGDISDNQGKSPTQTKNRPA